MEGVEACEEGSGLGEGAGLMEEWGLHVCQADSSWTPVLALWFLKWVSPSLRTYRSPELARIWKRCMEGVEWLCLFRSSSQGFLVG